MLLLVVLFAGGFVAGGFVADGFFCLIPEKLQTTYFDYYHVTTFRVQSLISPPNSVLFSLIKRQSSVT